MPKKKSYMNRKNIISEGFFGSILDAFKMSGVKKELKNLDKSNEKSIKKLRKEVSKFKKLQADFDKEFEEVFGVKLDPAENKKYYDVDAVLKKAEADVKKHKKDLKK